MDIEEAMRENLKEYDRRNRRRYAVAFLPHEFLDDALRGRVIIPDDYEIVNMFQDFVRMGWLLHLRCHDFKVVPEGQVPPELWKVVTSDGKLLFARVPTDNLEEDLERATPE